MLEYQLAIRADPGMADAYLKAATPCSRSTTRPGALAAYVRAADLLPNNIDAKLKAGSMRLMARQFPEAQKLAEDAIALDPKNVVAIVLKANALARLKTWMRRSPRLKRQSRSLPTRRNFTRALADWRCSRKRWRTRRLRIRRPSPWIRNPCMRTRHLGASTGPGAPAEAEKVFLKAVELDSANLLANRALSTFYLASGRPAQAERFLQAEAAASTGHAARDSAG